MTFDWFRALMDSAPEVYFRYAFAPARRFAYVSRAIEPLTGYTADAFYSDPAFCVSLVYAGTDELHQTFVHGRHGTPIDVGIDAAGMVVACILVARRQS